MNWLEFLGRPNFDEQKYYVVKFRWFTNVSRYLRIFSKSCKNARVY